MWPRDWSSDVCSSDLHYGHHLGRQYTARPAHQVNGHNRAAAHRINIADRIGRSNPAPIIWRIDHRGEEIRGGQDRGVTVDADGRGVIAVIHPDNHAVKILARQLGNGFLQLAGWDFTSAPTTGSRGG